MSTRQMKPLPFPGESPTVALAMAAGRQYGLNPEDEKPSRKPKKKKASPAKATAKKARKSAAKKPRR